MKSGKRKNLPGLLEAKLSCSLALLRFCSPGLHFDSGDGGVMDDQPKLCFGSLLCSYVVLLFFLCFGFFLAGSQFYSPLFFSPVSRLGLAPVFSSPFQSNSPSFSSLFVSLPSLLCSRRRQMVVKALGFVAG